MRVGLQVIIWSSSKDWKPHMKRAKISTKSGDKKSLKHSSQKREKDKFRSWKRKQLSHKVDHWITRGCMVTKSLLTLIKAQMAKRSRIRASLSLSLLSITLSKAINHANESQISKLCPSQPAILQIPLGVEPPNFFFIDPMNPVPSQFRFFSTQALRYHHMFSDFSPRFWGPNRSNPSPMVVAQTG